MLYRMLSRFCAALPIVAVGFLPAASSADVVPMYSISGRVLDPNGVPADQSDVLVTLTILGCCAAPPVHVTTQAAADGTFTASVQTSAGTPQETIEIQAYGMTLSSTFVAKPTTALGDVTLPANATELDEVRVVDTNGDPVPGFGFNLQNTAEGAAEGPSGCTSQVQASASSTMFNAACDPIPLNGTDATGTAHVWAGAGLTQAHITASYTDPAGVQHTYDGQPLVTRHAAGSAPPATILYALGDVDLVPPPSLAGFTVQGGPCGTIAVRFTPLTAPTVPYIQISRDGVALRLDQSGLPSSGSASGVVTLPVSDAGNLGTYTNCSNDHSYKQGTYTVTGAAFNANGLSTTQSATLVIGDLPLNPLPPGWVTGLSVAQASTNALTVTWPQLPPTNPTTASITLTATPRDGTAPSIATVPYGATTATLPIIGGKTYHVVMGATNAVGTGAYDLLSRATAAAPPATGNQNGQSGPVPGAVAGLKAKVRGRTVTLTWRMPVSHSPVLGYTVYRRGSGPQSVKAPKAVIRNLKPGVYRFSVAAFDKYGLGHISKTIKVRIA